MFHLYPIVLSGLEKEFRAVKFLRALKLIEEIINSNEFKEWFLAQSFTQLYDNRFKENADLLENLLQTIQFTYDIRPRPWYKRFSSVIGYTIGSDIVTYRDSYDGMDLAEFCGHLSHECCHVLGFTHDFKYSKARDSSVPYKIGSYVKDAVAAKIGK